MSTEDQLAFIPLINTGFNKNLSPAVSNLQSLAEAVDELSTLTGNKYILHNLATAVSDFLVASGAGVFVKKTLAEVKTILDLGEISLSSMIALANVTIPASYCAIVTRKYTIPSGKKLIISSNARFRIL